MALFLDFLTGGEGGSSGAIFRWRLAPPGPLPRPGIGPVATDLRAALLASCLRGAAPFVDFRAVCLVRAPLVGLPKAEESLCRPKS